MFLKLKYLTLILSLALPVIADAEQSRGRGQHRGQGGQGQGRQGVEHRGPSGRPRADAPRPGTRTPRADALAPPAGLAQALLPAGARRLPTSPPNARYANWRRWPQTGSSWWKYYKFDGYPVGGYYGGSYLGYDTGAPAGQEPSDAPVSAAMATNKGLLQLAITPATGLDYYVDGVYIGSSSNLGDQFEINAGARQVEVRARGYKPATFDTRIDEGRVTTVRGALEAEPQAQQAPRNTGSRVVYVIPGCYMGNTKPEKGTLPAGCDVRKMVTRGAGL